MATNPMVAGLRLPAANGLCQECLTTKLPKIDNPRTIIIYCEHNQAGAIMPSRDGELDGRWLIMTPISAGEFTDRLTNGRLPTFPELA